LSAPKVLKTSKDPLPVSSKTQRKRKRFAKGIPFKKKEEIKNG